jgi:hypothetical protein
MSGDKMFNGSLTAQEAQAMLLDEDGRLQNTRDTIEKVIRKRAAKTNHVTMTFRLSPDDIRKLRQELESAQFTVRFVMDRAEREDPSTDGRAVHELYISW